MHADRRDVLKMIAAAPFLGMFGRPAPAAETGTVQTATASGRQILWRTFEGPFTSQIAFPLGGIGTGTVSLGGRGNLTDWEIANAPAKGRQLANTFFALWYGAPEGGRAYILEAKIPPPYLGWGGLAREGMPGMPRFARGRFLGAYPFARLELSDPDVPLEVTLEAFNPFIPLNDRDSGLPVATFYWRIKNTGARALPLTLLFSLQNMAGNRQLGQNLNRFQDDGTIRGLQLTTRKHRPSSPHYGELALTTSHREVTYQTRWARGAWFDDQSLFWKDFAEDGILERRFEEGPSGPEETDTGCLGLRDRLDAGATKVFPFVLAWYFPNRANTWNSELQWTELRSDRVAGKVLRNFYATLFNDAWSVARYTVENLERLERETRDFHQALFTSTLPDFVLDAVSSQSSIMRTETVFRTAEGRLWGFEGTKDDLGCCPLNCTHVWNYEQALAFLFPALERTMREVDFTHNTLPEGNMAFRTLLPLGDYHWRRELAAADGQMGTVVKLYREWKLSGDDPFLRRLWPAAKRALEYAWKRWDADRDGVMEGVQHNTYDIEFLGPNTMMGTIYLAALRAGEEMARALGDEGSAKLYREVYESGRLKLEQACWKGDYYVQVYEKAKETKYQLGDGCLSDQLLGQWMAHVTGLGYVLPPENVRKALAAVFAHNWKPQLTQHQNPQRIFALGDEAGLLLCSWPRGNRPDLPFVYSDEVWTGIEYQVAAHLIYEGMVDEGLKVVEGVRNRYDGERRNPWNEIECGNHYARAMASWSLLLALSGFYYDGPSRSMAFAPVIRPEDFASFWSCGAGWGTYHQRLAAGRLAAELSLLYGDLTLASFRLPRPSSASATGSPKVEARLDDRSLAAEASREGDRITVRFSPEARISRGSLLTVALG